MVLLAAHLYAKMVKHAMVNHVMWTKQLVSAEMDPLSQIVQVSITY